MFDGFEARYVVTPEATIPARLGGEGPGLLFLRRTPGSGHHLAEENPAATLAALEPFLAGGNRA